MTIELREDERRIADIARALALEVGGARAASAVSPTASLEREVGLGSLERVELIARLEAALDRDLPDRFLLLDTPREIARALGDLGAPFSAAPTLDRLPIPMTEAAPSLELGDVPTLGEVLRRRAWAHPDRIHVHLELDEGRRAITYGALRDGAAAVAAGLAARGVQRGDRVAIMLPTGSDFLESFMGIVAAGAVAVPLYPPARLDRMAEYLQRQTRILVNADARLLIAMPEALPLAGFLRTPSTTRTDIATVGTVRSAVPDADPAQWPPVGSADDPALIQYTSGSTGDPKGVLLTHGNLLANIRAISVALAIRPTDAGVSWLPLYHDMGLIGAWLGALVEGFPITLMSPLAFLGRAERWLWAIHERQATLSAAPNFAYELCVRRIREDAIEGLDLSSWRCALNGSEAVSAGTLDRFARRFERYGFRRESLMPVYGLAESSVALCFPPVGRVPLVDQVVREPFERTARAIVAPHDDATALRFASVGGALPGLEVRLVDDSGQEVADRTVGRVTFRGASCMKAYYRNPDATARVTLPGGWLDSGDLGYRSGGELFVTGRVKDLIIKSGRNLVPQEIEEVAASIEGVRKGCVAAFGITDEAQGTERLIVLAESRIESAKERDAIASAVVAAVGAGVGVPPDDVRIVGPGTVPKTPSGKIRRAAARELYRSGRIRHRGGAPMRLRALLLAAGGKRILREVRAKLARAAYLMYLAVAGTASMIVAIPLLWLPIQLTSSKRHVRELTRRAARRALQVAGCTLTVDGLHRLPARGPLVLVANHASYADTPALLAALPADVVIVAMREILRWPVIGSIVQRAGHPTVDRWQPQQSVADAAAIEARLRAGEMMLFFPEGRMSEGRGLRSFRLGAFEAAVAVGAPVVPIALSGTRRVLPAGRWLPHRGRIDVWIGEPLTAEEKGWNAAIALRDRSADAIAARTREPRLEIAGGSRQA